MQRQLLKFATGLFLATTAVTAFAMTVGTEIAGATTRLRSGAVHAQFATTHVASNTGGASGLHLTGPDVMAAVVAVMAVLAMLFLVVTFIRRRVSISA